MTADQQAKELREAVSTFTRWRLWHESSLRASDGIEDASVLVFAAARKELARLEGKALVIEPDEEALALALEDEKRIIDPDFDDYTIEVNSANFAAIYQVASRYLDALRDAMPEREATNPVCELCGGPMPEGEEMFKYHGYSGPCPSDAKPERGGK